ncbi:6-pyruvoyl trahydropterin synthase family protein [Bacteriovorax sp. BSW11_IV]|uniref:6-pyruvoyl trahydropterin synthase family protein n=1 Tax=Bacteriovorax sp. BSW11_IV TaxID=1353529 RepID=UPI000556433C|nr:6-carboxytetrahydropterin synthase [Bacteriovorax sp. BSW11_IV]
MNTEYSIRVYKQYFNFASSHFMLFKDGTREPLHGHNYRVTLKADAIDLEGDMVFDFLDIKPIVREVCDSLDHKLLIPGESTMIEILDKDTNYEMKTLDGSFFSMPKTDVLILPILNTSAERIAIYITHEIKRLVSERFSFQFKNIEVEVEETPGQCAVYRSE